MSSRTTPSISRSWPIFKLHFDIRSVDGRSHSTYSSLVRLGVLQRVWTSANLRSSEDTRQVRAIRVDISYADWLSSDRSQVQWSTDGCRLIATNATHSSCSCNHLTTFALRVETIKVGEGEKSEPDISFPSLASGQVEEQSFDARRENQLCSLDRLSSANNDSADQHTVTY